MAPNIGSYAARDGWFVRFQLQGPVLRAKAWQASTTSVQPADWTLSATDTSISRAGNVSVRSSNSGSAARPVVKFSRFWVQTLGFTVHAWMRPDRTIFPGEDSQKYIYWMGKGTHGHGRQEWVFRQYSEDAPQHTGWVSFYIYNASGGKGAGAAYHGDELGLLKPGRWYQFVAVLDSGDHTDLQAGVRLYMNGNLVDGPPSSGALYTSFNIVPQNGSAPVQLATRDRSSFLSGGLDEVALFDRALTADEILSLYNSAL